MSCDCRSSATHDVNECYIGIGDTLARLIQSQMNEAATDTTFSRTSCAILGRLQVACCQSYGRAMAPLGHRGLVVAGGVVPIYKDGSFYESWKDVSFNADVDFNQSSASSAVC